MKNLLVVLAFAFVSAGCAPEVDYKIDTAAACTGGPNLVLSSVTPTNFVFTRNTGIIRSSVSLRVEGTKCEMLIPSLRIQTAVMDAVMSSKGPSNNNVMNVTVDNIPFDTTSISSVTGTLTFWISTPTRTSNTITGKITIP